jgi:hypothetical protein
MVMHPEPSQAYIIAIIAPLRAGAKYIPRLHIAQYCAARERGCMDMLNPSGPAALNAYAAPFLEREASEREPVGS